MVEEWDTVQLLAGVLLGDKAKDIHGEVVGVAMEHAIALELHQVAELVHEILSASLMHDLCLETLT